MMHKIKFSVTVAVLIALVVNSASLAAVPERTQPAMAKEAERLVARSLGLTGDAEEDFVERIEIRELTGKALQQAVLAAQADAKSRVALKYLQQRGHKMLDGTATGLTVVEHSDTDPRSATLLMWDYQGPTARQMAKFLHLVDDQGVVRVGVGLIRLQHGEARHFQVFDVQGDELIQEATWAIREDGTVVGEGVGNLHLPPNHCGTTRVSGLKSDDDCNTCMSVCERLYAVGCGWSAILACFILCIPFAGPACPVICGAVYVVLCVLSGWQGCTAVCGPAGLGYCN